MKKFLPFLMAILFFMAFTPMVQGQLISYPSAAQSITRGFDSTLLTVRIDFPACTNPVVTVNLGATNSPGTVEYIAGSLVQTGGSAGVTVTESNISNLSNPQFAVSTTTAGQFVTFTIKRRIGCGTASSSKDNIVVSGGCSFSETDVNVNTYNVLAPSLTLNPPAALANTGVGSSYDRTFTVNNGGNGCVDTLFVWIKYPAGSATLNSLKIGATTLTAAYTNGDSTLFKVAGTNLTADGKLCNGESITFTENFTVLKCNFTTTYGTAWNDYTNSFCQTATQSVGITMNNNLPNLSVSLITPTADAVDYCYRGDSKIQTIRITNTGAGTATNLLLYLRTFLPGSYSGLIRLDTVGGYAIRNSAGVQIGTIPGGNFTRYNSAGANNTSCTLVSTAITELTAVIPSNIIIPAGSYIEIDVKTWVPNNTCTTCQNSQVWVGLSSQVAYKNQCGLGSYQENYKQLISGRLTNFAYTVEHPVDINGYAPNNTFNITISTSQFQNMNNPDGTGTTYFAMPLANTDLAPNASSITVNGYTLPVFVQNDTLFIGPFPQNNSSTFANQVINLPMVANCTAGSGTKALQYFVLNSYSDCAPVQKMNCNSSSITIHCPNPCPKGGATPLLFTLSRVNYGLPDNDNNGQPDATGTIDVTKIMDHRSVNGDTLQGTWNVKVYPNVEPTDPNVGQNFNYVYFDFNLVRGTATLGSKGSLNALPNAVATIFPAGGGASITCTVSPTLSGTIAHYELSSSCRGSAWQAGDSIVFRAKYTVNEVNGYNYSRLYEQGFDLFTTRNEVYSSYTQKTTANTAPVDAQLYTCDHYNDYSQMSKFWLSPYMVSNQVINGCTGTIQAYMREYLRFQEANNIFLYEYRNFYIPDTIKVQIPPGFVYRPGSGSFIPAALPILDANVLLSGDTLIFVNLKNFFKPYGGTLVPPDETGVWGVQFNLNPTCTAAAGFYPSYTNTWGIGNGLNTPTSDYYSANPNVNASGYVYNPPQPTLTGGGTINSTDGTGSWTVVLQNISNSVAADNSWFYIDPIVGLSNIVVKEGATTLTPNANGFYQLGNLASGANRTFTITAKSTTCTPDSMRINMGFDCGAYPTSFALQSCTKTTWLKLVNLESQIQLTVTKQPIVLPATTIDLCTPGTAEFVINSAQAAFADNPVFNVTPPAGLTITGGQIEYPLGSGNWQTITPTISGGVYSYAVESHTQLQTLWGTKGMPGTLDYSGTDQRQAKLRVTFTTDCNFTSGAKLTVQQQAWRPCGDAISTTLGFNNIVRTDPINVTGAPTTAAAAMDMSLSPTTVSCGATTISGSAIPVAVASSSRDTIVVTLPAGVTYNSGSFSSLDGATLVSGSPFAGANGTTILKIKVPSGVAPGNTIGYSYGVTATQTSGCGNFEILADYQRTSDPLSCNGTTCPNDSKAILGTKSSFITVERPAITMNSLTVVSGNFSPGGTVTLNVNLTNTSTISAAANSMLLEFYCVGNTLPFATALYPQAVAGGATVSTNITLTVPTTPLCNGGTYVTAVINPANGTCICSKAQVTSSVVLPVVLNRFTMKAVGECELSLEWEVGTEENMDHYEIERSEDGVRFEKIGEKASRGSGSLYNILVMGTEGLSYYRLKMVDKDGRYAYSEVLKGRDVCSRIQLLPSVTSGITYLRGVKSGDIVRVYNGVGQEVKRGKAEGSGRYEVELGNLAGGVYLVTVVRSGEPVFTGKVIKR